MQVGPDLVPAGGVRNRVSVEGPIEGHVSCVGDATFQGHALTFAYILVLRMRLKIVAVLAATGR